MDLTILAGAAGQILADSSSDSNGNIGLLFFLSGFIFYIAMFLRYRNTNKRHHHESETEATLDNVRAVDDFTKSLRGLSNSKMRGANNEYVAGAQNKGLGLW